MRHAEALEVLGLGAGATQEEVRSSYKKMAMQWHPDKCSAANATEMFQKVSHAYEVLTGEDSEDEDEEYWEDDDGFYRDPRDIFEEVFASMFFSRGFPGRSPSGMGGFPPFFASRGGGVPFSFFPGGGGVHFVPRHSAFHDYDDDYDYYDGVRPMSEAKAARLEREARERMEYERRQEEIRQRKAEMAERRKQRKEQVQRERAMKRQQEEAKKCAEEAQEAARRRAVEEARERERVEAVRAAKKQREESRRGMFAAAAEGRWSAVLDHLSTDPSLACDREKVSSGAGLLHACVVTHTNAVRTDGVDRVLLIRRILDTPGVDLSWLDKDGLTVLHSAAKAGDDELITLLLDARSGRPGQVDVDKLCLADGYAPLHYAAAAASPAAVARLLSAGAKVQQTTEPLKTGRHKMTALEIVSWLVKEEEKGGGNGHGKERLRQLMTTRDVLQQRQAEYEDRRRAKAQQPQQQHSGRKGARSNGATREEGEKDREALERALLEKKASRLKEKLCKGSNDAADGSPPALGIPNGHDSFPSSPSSPPSVGTSTPSTSSPPGANGGRKRNKSKSKLKKPSAAPPTTTTTTPTSSTLKTNVPLWRTAPPPQPPATQQAPPVDAMDIVAQLVQMGFDCETAYSACMRPGVAEGGIERALEAVLSAS